MLGTPNCGKGEPGQVGHVGHGVPGPASATSRSGSASGERARRPEARRGRRALRPGRGALLADGARAAGAHARPRRSSLAEDSALTRFANSEIHQNVAETNVAGQPALRRRQAGRRRLDRATDDEGLRRLAETAGAIARIVEELEDWAGAARAGRGPPTSPAACSAGDGRRHARARAPTARGRSSPRPTRPASTAFGSFSTDAEPIAVANSRGRPRRRDADRRRSSSPCRWAPTAGPGYAEACAVDATTIDAAALGREAAEQGARDRRAPVADRAGRLPGRPRGVRRRRHRSTCSATSASRALAVQEDRSFFEPGRRVGSRPRDDLGRRRRPRRPADGLRLRGRRQAAGPARRARASAATSSTTPRRPPAPASASTGHGLPAPNPYGPFPLNMSWPPATRLARRAHRRPRPRPPRHPLPLHEPGPPEARDRHGHDPRRDVPRGGRADRRAGPQPALHPELPRRAGRGRGGRPRARRSRASSAAVSSRRSGSRLDFTGDTEH